MAADWRFDGHASAGASLYRREHDLCDTTQYRSGWGQSAHGKMSLQVIENNAALDYSEIIKGMENKMESGTGVMDRLPTVPSK